MSYELIFTSLGAADLGPQHTVGIVERARIRNRREGITGLMAFDGVRYCQLIEGEQTSVERLADVICRDSRHSEFAVLHRGTQTCPRRFPQWPLAFAMYDGDSLAKLIELHAGPKMGDHLQATPDVRVDSGL
jgi:hypothetical protein